MTCTRLKLPSTFMYLNGGDGVYVGKMEVLLFVFVVYSLEANVLLDTYAVVYVKV